MSLWRARTSWMSRGNTPAGAEQVDLKHQRIDLVVLVQQMLQRRVGNDTAVPEMIGADFHHRERGRQRAAGHHVFGPDHFLLVVEIQEVAGEHVNGADREVDLARIDQVEIHQLQQGLAQRLGVIIAGRGFRAGGTEPRVDIVRLEEAGLAQRRRHPRTGEVAGLAIDVAVRCIVPHLARGDALPEDS